MSDSPENAEYYLRLVYMYIDLGTEIVLRLFYNCKPKEELSQFLLDSKGKLINLKQRKVLNKRQFNLVTAYCPDADKFDIALLITLLTSLFPKSVAEPPKGWNCKPEDSDLSVGADLFRLRKVRNNVLFHRPKAQLEKFQFDRQWSHLSEILIRIIKQIEPTDEEIFKEKIEKYKSRKLNANQDSKYDNTLRAWEEEIDEMQTQVEELLGTLKEFDTFFKHKPERFKRYVKLMIDGGILVLKSVLYKELDKRNQDIVQFLQVNEQSLRSKMTNATFIDNLFPKVSSNVECAMPDNWDVVLLAEVLLYGFDDLTPEDKEDIEAIRNAINCYAETALLSLDSDRFTGVLIELTNRLTLLAAGLDKETKKQLKDLIAVCSKSDENIVLPEDYLNSLQTKGLRVKSLVDVHKETINKLKEYLNQMEIDGINLKREHKLEIKIQTTSRNQNSAGEAEETIFTVLRESIRKAVNTSGLPNVRHEIDKMLESLTSHTDVTKVDVERRCIILGITCSSLSSIQHVIRVFESDAFQDLSYNLSIVMTNELQDTVAIQSHFTLESLYEVFEGKDETHEDREIVMKIPYSTTTELKSILSPFETRELTNNVNRISGQLSSHFNETVTLAVTHEMKGISDSDISDSSPKSEDFENDEKCLNVTKNHYSRNKMIVDTKKESIEDLLESNMVESPSTSSARSKEQISADVTEIDLQQSLHRWRAEWYTNKEELKGETTGLFQMYCQLITFVVDICQKPLCERFLSHAKDDKRVQFNDLKNYLQARKDDVNNLRRNFKINALQYFRLYPSLGAVDIQTWDVSLLIALLLELFSDNLQREELECLYKIQKIWDELKHIGNSSFLSHQIFHSYMSDLESAVCKLSQYAGAFGEQNTSNYEKPDYERRVPDHISVSMYETLKQELELCATEIQCLRKETAQSSKILSKTAVKRQKRSGKSEKRMKVIDSRVERMKEMLTRAMFEYNDCEVSHKDEIDQIIQKLSEHNRVVVTGQNNDVIYKCALAAVKQMADDNCLEINDPTDWQRIFPDDAELVLFRAPFGRLTYDSRKADAMMEQVDNILMASDDKVQNIIIVTHQSALNEVVRRHEHELLSALCTVTVDSETKDAEYAHARADTVHNNIQEISHIYKKRYTLKTINNHIKETAEKKFINHYMVTIVGPAGSGKTTLSFHLLPLYDLSNGEENFLVIMDPSEVKYVHFFLRPVIIIKLLSGAPFDKVEAYKWYRQFDRLYAAIRDNKIAVITIIETEVFKMWRKNMSTHPVLEHVVEIPSSKTNKKRKGGHIVHKPAKQSPPYQQGNLTYRPESGQIPDIKEGNVPYITTTGSVPYTQDILFPVTEGVQFTESDFAEPFEDIVFDEQTDIEPTWKGNAHSIGLNEALGRTEDSQIKGRVQSFSQDEHFNQSQR